MKTFIVASLFVLLFISAFSQEIYYEVHGRYLRPIKQKDLLEAKLIKDIVPGYPLNWITSYDKVEISTTHDGKVLKARSKNDILNTEQKNILKSIGIGSDIIINVRYKYMNPSTDKLENNNINTIMTAVPDVEAEFVGGHDQMIKYLMDNSINKIPAAIAENFPDVAIRFTVNENGDVTNAKVRTSSMDEQTDKLFLDVVSKMPRWRPAENSAGVKVKQDFEFTIGKGGC